MDSFLGVPIVWADESLGNIYLTNKIGADAFSEEDEELLKMLAAHASIAIQNAHLYEEVERLAVLEERTRAVVSSSRCGGKPCQGPLGGTEPCEKQGCFEQVDCELGEWTDWSSCKEGGVQRSRHRLVHKEGKNGGKVCEGSLEETWPCEAANPPSVRH